MSNSLFLAVRSQVRHAAFRGVDAGAAEGLFVHILVGHGLDHLGAGQKHVAVVAHHDGEVGQRRGIDGPAGAGAENTRQLRDNPRGLDIAQENLGVAGQALDSLLDAGPSRVVETDHRGTVLHGHIHDLADLFGEGFG